MTSRWVQEGSRWVRRGSLGHSDEEATARESSQTPEEVEAATPPDAAPEVSESPSLPLDRPESDKTCSEAASSESESDERPNSTVIDKSTKQEMISAIEYQNDLEKVKTLIKQHPDLLR